MIEVYPTLGGPGGGFGPHFIIKGGKLYRAYGHPQGESWNACCYRSGNYFHRELGDTLFSKKYNSFFEQAMDHQGPVFEQRGDYLYTGTGHPDGEGKMYYELRKKEEVQKSGSSVTSQTHSSSTSSAGSGIVEFIFDIVFAIPAKVYGWLILSAAHTIYTLYALRKFPSPDFADIAASAISSLFGIGALVLLVVMWQEPKSRQDKAFFNKTVLISFLIAAGHTLYRIPTLIWPEYRSAQFLQQKVFAIWVGSTVFLFTFIIGGMFVGMLMSHFLDSKK